MRLGAGGRSYMVQDKKIGVLRNVHGGVQVDFFQTEHPVMMTRTEESLQTAAACTSSVLT